MTDRERVTGQIAIYVYRGRWESVWFSLHRTQEAWKAFEGGDRECREKVAEMLTRYPNALVTEIDLASGYANNGGR